ncbi:glycosyltransferase family 39 protein [Natronolimnobius sp. AArcel1]|uniref:glycosyltransferase family 39 protein n=1 Tax=Natronolimnobius sp. AArcel1 TaxID=1679093 RepID=UPI0013ECB3D5|nr:glycosyltransferase family 39 protein [Natronolimnobius sp. AArcel1]NGM70442.1 glycosyltransferase family 39 protein [Natronolimnobius sp. AArcel1]
MVYRKLADARPFRLDTVAALLGLTIAIGLLPLQLLASQVYLNTVPIVLGTACGLYLLSLYQEDEAGTVPTLPSSVAMALPGIVLAATAGLVAIVIVQETRTPLFFAAASLVATTIVGQIFFTSDDDFHPGVLVLQIVLFAFVFRFTALYATPGYIGIDIWTHAELTEAILLEESLSGIADDKHYAAPFYHLLVAASALVYDVPIRLAVYLSVGLVMPLSVLLVYATTNLLVPARWATLSAACYAVASHVTLWGLHPIPTSLGLVFFLGMLYALIRVMRIEYTIRDFSLLVLMSVAVVLTHQVSTFIMLVLLLAAFVAQLVFVAGPLGLTRLDTSVFRAKKPVNLVGLVVFNIGLTIFAWSLTPYRQDSFLETILSFFTETLEESAGFLNIASGSTASDEQAAEEAATSPTLLEQLVPYLDILGFLFLLGATFVGCLYVVHRRRAEQSVFTLLLASAFMLVFVLGFPMFGIHNFIPNRWFAFLFAPMAILGAIGLRTLSTNLNPTVVTAVLLVFALVFPGAMIVAAESNIDNPIFGDQHERLAYDEPDLAAANSIADLTGSPAGSEIRPDQQLHTDHPYQTVITRTGAYPSTTTASVPEDGVTDHDYTVYRSAQSSDGVYFTDEYGDSRIDHIDQTQLCRADHATVYTNGDVTMCTPSPASSS